MIGTSQKIVGASGRNYTPRAPEISNQIRNAITKVTQDDNLSVVLPSQAIDLKFATSSYAMHLSLEERNRIFAELDYLLNVEGWNEEDAVPERPSYVNFLKFLIESKRCDWSSLGFDAEGNLLCAFVSERGTVTAAFQNTPIVHWTGQFQSEDGVEIAAGHSPLRTFVATAEGLLNRL